MKLSDLDLVNRLQEERTRWLSRLGLLSDDPGLDIAAKNSFFLASDAGEVQASERAYRAPAGSADAARWQIIRDMVLTMTRERLLWCEQRLRDLGVEPDQ